MGLWKEMLRGGDSHSYYLHVVSFFIHDDVGQYDRSIAALKEIYPAYSDPRLDPYGIRPTEKGRLYIKYPVGVGVMETPFFLIAHLVAKLSPEYKEDGWSTPYFFFIGISTMCYVLIALSILFSLLTRYFSARTAFITLLTIALATNLFYQSTWVAMAHGFLFFLHTVLIYLTIQFYERPRIRTAIGLGATIGMITITRVPEVLTALIPLLWGVYNRTTLTARIQFIGKHARHLLYAFAAFALVSSIQVFYWHYVSGKLFFNPYSGETLNLLKSHLIGGWFHFSNGWLIYAPVMSLSLLGWFFLRRYYPQALVPSIVFVLLHAYVHYSWYAWTYFPGFGSRPMVETYALLSFSLAAFYLWCTKSRFTQWIPVTCLVLFSALNLFQTWQQSQGIIYSEQHNKAFYVESFGKTKHTLHAMRAWDSKEIQPDTNDLELLSTLVMESFEDSISFNRSDSIKHSGSYSLYDPAEHTYQVSIPFRQLEGGDWIEIGTAAFMLPQDKPENNTKCALLTCELVDEKGKRIKGRGINIARQIGNVQYSFWSAGETNVWGIASCFIKLPGKRHPEGEIRLGIWNPHHQKIHIDDLFVKHYKKK